MFTLNPEINREPFTVEEDCILMAAIKEYGLNYREFPTNLLPGRSMKQIRSRYNNVLRHVKVREHWMEKHDRKLMDLVEKYGTSDWVKIADEMVSHSRTSCRQRYNTIRKFLNKNPNKTISHVPRRKRPFSTNVTTQNWMQTIIEAKHLESNQITQNDSIEDGTMNQTMTKPSETTILKSTVYNASYFDFLKYSFNFKLCGTIAGSEALFENVQIACQLMQAPTIPKQIDISNPLFCAYVMNNNAKKIQLEADLLRSLSELGKNDFVYPLNMNTIFGMRALTIMFEANKKGRSHDQNAIKTEHKIIHQHDALNLFKMRFKSLFKLSASIAQLHRVFTSVSLRLRCQKVRKPTATTTTTTTPISVNESENNASLQSVALETAVDNIEYSDSDALTLDGNDAPPRKLFRFTKLDTSQESTSKEFPYSCYKYRVETSNEIDKIHIQSYISESETDGFGDETDFVIWTPTITDEATGSTANHPHTMNE